MTPALGDGESRQVEPPRAELCRALRRLGSEGERAERFLVGSAEQLNRPGTQAGEMAAYALREALMSLIGLGGTARPGIGEKVDLVVRAWKLSSGDADADRRLDEAIGDLEQARKGLGPNEQRLESAITKLARRQPTRANADLLERFIELLDAANKGAHASLAVGAAVDLYGGSVDVIESLFGPITDRLANVDELLEVGDPSLEDVARLLSLAGDDRHLAYFFEKVEGSAWMRALADKSILKPPDEGAWAAGPYISRVAESDGDLVRDWLTARSTEDLAPQQVSFLLRIAVPIGTGVSTVVLKLARPYLELSDVQFQIESYVGELSDEELREPQLRSLVKWTLQALLAGERRSIDNHLAARLIEVSLRAMATADADPWLKVLMHRLRELAESESEFGLRAIRPLSELRLGARSRSGLELISAAVRDGVGVANEAGVSPESVLGILEQVPEPLRARLIAAFLHDRFASLEVQARQFIAAQVASNDYPSAEELGLLRAMSERAEPALMPSWKGRLACHPPPRRYRSCRPMLRCPMTCDAPIVGSWRCRGASETHGRRLTSWSTSALARHLKMEF